LPIAVSVVPATVSLLAGGSQDFTATVANDPANTGVTWSITGCAGDPAACGSLTNVTNTMATYTAPATVPAAALGVTATSVADGTKSSTATVAITAMGAGGEIAFSSNLDGNPEIYVMNADGSGVTRISYGKGRYATPVWSPRGDLIAFTKQMSGSFLIGVMRSDGSGERILTEGYHNEGPTWAPNGRVLMFFRESRGAGGGPKLFSIDLTGYNERQVATPAFGSDPAWSPLRN
jgi:hypothetical protein